MKYYGKIIAIAALLPFALFASQTVYLDDHFNEGNRNNQNLPASAQWFGEALSVAEVSAGNKALKNAPTSAIVLHAVSYFAPAGSPVTLAAGESMKLTFDVTPVSKNPESGPNHLRFGLLYSDRTRLTSDANISLSVQGGYGVFTNPQRTATTFREKGTVRGPLFSSVSRDRWTAPFRGSAPDGGSLTMVKDTTYSIEYVITRKENGSLDLYYSITDGTRSTSVRANRSVNPLYSYDTVGFAWGSAFGDGLINNVKVVHQTGN